MSRADDATSFYGWVEWLEQEQQRAESTVADDPFWQTLSDGPRDALNEELRMIEYHNIHGDDALRLKELTLPSDDDDKSPPSISHLQSSLWPTRKESPPPAPGYMARPSAFSLDLAPTETSFMSLYPEGNGIITYHDEHNEIKPIRNVNVNLVAQRCPVLGLAFEDSRSGPQLHLELLDHATAIPFLRFLYTGSYALCGGPGAGADNYDDAPTSVLLHCCLYRLGEVYGLSALKTQAYVNVLRQCEFGCSSPDKPIDLCAAIRFIYKELREHANLIDALVHYCVSCFLSHTLSIDPEFKELAYNLRVFHQDLCQAVMGRDIENAVAVAIIQMPFNSVAPVSRIPVHESDVAWQFHGEHEVVGDMKPKKTKRGVPGEGETTELPLRKRRASVKAEGKMPVKDLETVEIGEKRAVSSRSEATSPVVGGISQLHQVGTTTQLVEAEYEVVSCPSTGDRTLSDSESESADFVEITKEDAEVKEVRSLPYRTQQGNPMSNDDVTNAGSDSESEWTLL